MAPWMLFVCSARERQGLSSGSGVELVAACHPVSDVGAVVTVELCTVTMATV